MPGMRGDRMMARLFSRLSGQAKRTVTQAAFTLLTNSHFSGFARGALYQGGLKRICVPGLNCYSCPGALGSCPVGALQAVAASRSYDFSYYVVGLVILFGLLLGRLVCGWLCPFGLVQDLLYRAPTPKLRRMPGDQALRWLKYAILLLLVFVLPAVLTNAVGIGEPLFCKWICPSGTLFAGLPLAAADGSIRAALGRLFGWKLLVLLALLSASVFLYRPFCKYLCPLGALYGPFNQVSLYGYTVSERCTHCQACRHVCPMQVQMPQQPNSSECIRCGRCRDICPEQAIHSGWRCGSAAKAARAKKSAV